jgi:hypothetical protein
MSFLESTEIAHLIQLAVAPVFLLSGVGVTLGVLTNRLARIVDRARALELEPARDTAHGEEMQVGLSVLRRRARYINAAITLSSLSALLVALTVVLLFANAFSTLDLAGPIALTFVAAMLALTAGLGYFLVEVRLATATLRIGGRR